jgi:hypothetical protein
MKGRPFILLGVNSDNAPDVAAQVEQQEGIAARSWRDGGELYGGRTAHQWNIRALPATYVIDHRGIIRYKLGPRADGHDTVVEIFDAAGQVSDKWQVRAEEIAAVVDELVTEAEREGSKAPAEPIERGP